MWFKYYKGYYDVRKLELELVSWRERDLLFGWKQTTEVCGIFVERASGSRFPSSKFFGSG